jgi:hypothetical protein
VTRLLQKRRERFFVEEAARALNKAWRVGPDRLHPDFLVTEGTHQFGLEVAEIFKGPLKKAGSAMKEMESNVQRSIELLRTEYEAASNIPLSVKFAGTLKAETKAKVIQALVAEEFGSKPLGHHAVIDVAKGLRVFATRAIRPDWLSVNDCVGWVNANPTTLIADLIQKKSKKLPKYLEAAGPDMRLLIVADRIHNSGKMVLEERPSLNLRGFRVVYFYSYPDSVTVSCASPLAS